MDKTLSKRAVALASAVLTLGLGTGIAAATALSESAREASTAQLDLRAAGVRGALDTTFQRYADTLHDVTALSTASGAGASTDALSVFVGRITTDRLPGAYQVVVVSPTGTILAEQTLDGSTPPPRTVLAPAAHLAATLETARETGRPTAGPAHTLPADRDLPPAHRQSAVDLVAPIHDKTFEGWVVIGVRTGDLLRTSLTAAGISGVTTTLTETTPTGTTHQLASYGGSSAGESAYRVVDLALAGHTWQAEVRPAAALTAPSYAAPLAMLVATVVSLLLAGAVLTISALSRRITRTRELTHSDLAARDASPRAVSTELSARDAALSQLSTELSARDASLRELSAELSARDASLRELSTELNARDAALRERDASLRERDASLRERDASLRERDAELAGFAVAAGEHLHAPLHTIAGFTDLLQEEAPHLDEASRGFVDRIAVNTRRMLRLVDELVAYSAAGDAALKPVPVDTTGLALGVVADQLDGAAGRPSVDVGDLPTVLADADLVAEVLGQLVGNAVRYVRPGVAPAVTIGAREDAPGWWRIEVADRGIGVPEDQRARIFQPFQRASSAEGYPGTGLGLAICRRIVALHGGELGVEANPGGGSVFWFTMPATDLTPEFGPELFAANAM